MRRVVQEGAVSSLQESLSLRGAHNPAAHVNLASLLSTHSELCGQVC